MLIQARGAGLKRSALFPRAPGRGFPPLWLRRVAQGKRAAAALPQMPLPLDECPHAEWASLHTALNLVGVATDVHQPLTILFGRGSHLAGRSLVGPHLL